MNATDFNRHTLPPGGWSYYEPATGWRAPTPTSSTFDQTVTLIIAMRRKNPAITAKCNLATDREAVASELETYTRKRLGIGGPAPAPFPASRSSQGKSWAAVAGVVKESAANIKKLADGFGLLADWIPTGVAVPHEVAEERARICSTCPKNESGDFTAWFTVPASELIRKKLAKRNDLNLSTSSDDKINVCSACLCPLKLKVHTPAEHVLQHLRGDTVKDLAPGCWILKLR